MSGCHVPSRTLRFGSEWRLAGLSFQNPSAESKEFDLTRQVFRPLRSCPLVFAVSKCSGNRKVYWNHFLVFVRVLPMNFGQFAKTVETDESGE
jgi:hypothetical protein